MVFGSCLTLPIPCYDLNYENVSFLCFCWWCFPLHLNLASASWVLYSQANDSVGSGAVFLGLSTNNIIEYHAMIGLLTKNESCDINHLFILMDSHHVVSHLNHVYAIQNPVLLHILWRVRLLERSFESITYQHITRYYNSIVDSLVNYMLDWYIAHSWHIDE